MGRKNAGFCFCAERGADGFKKIRKENCPGLDIGLETIFYRAEQGIIFCYNPLLSFCYTADQAAACLLGLRPEGSQFVFLRCCLVFGLAVFAAGLAFGEREPGFSETGL